MFDSRVKFDASQSMGGRVLISVTDKISLPLWYKAKSERLDRSLSYQGPEMMHYSVTSVVASPWFLYVLCFCLLVCSVSSIFSRNSFSLVLSYYCWSHPFRFIGKSIREQCSKEWKNRKYSSIIITFPAFLFAKIIRIKLYFCNICNTIVKDWSKRGPVFSGSSTHKNANKKMDNF